MTRKKKDKDEVPSEVEKNDEEESSTKEENSQGNLALEESQENVEVQDVKLLKGDGQKVLEYHDLDDLLAESTQLKEDIKKDRNLISELQKEVKNWKDKHMRLQAEFENAQKRWNKNRENLRKEYIAYTLKTFLPLYDSFKKALEGGDKNNEVLKQFYDQYIGILKFHKAEPIETKPNDLFDYTNHEALSSIERDDIPNNSIVEIIQDGWKMDKDVLRFAKVIISREPNPPEPEPEPESQPELKKKEEVVEETTKKDEEKKEKPKELDKQPVESGENNQ